MDAPGNIQRYRVVPQAPRRRLFWPALALGWVLSVAAAWAAARWPSAPPAVLQGAGARALQAELDAASAELDRLRQQQAVLARSDQVSRAANREIQQELAERKSRQRQPHRHDGDDQQRIRKEAVHGRASRACGTACSASITDWI